MVLVLVLVVLVLVVAMAAAAAVEISADVAEVFDEGRCDLCGFSASPKSVITKEGDDEDEDAK